jgi:site-specific DNA-cytosine methylase
MKVIVGCEFSQIVTQAFRNRGHEAFSCDLLPTEGNPQWHFKEDVFEVLKRESFYLGIFHPPCTHLSVSGARWFAEKRADGRQQEGIDFFMRLVEAPIEKIAIENPVGIMSTIYRKPDQIIQPYWFGDPYQKATCLWLNGLPKLQPTNIVEGKEQKCWKEPPSLDRWKNRSRTYKGFAEAMATQWS